MHLRSLCTHGMSDYFTVLSQTPAPHLISRISTSLQQLTQKGISMSFHLDLKMSWPNTSSLLRGFGCCTLRKANLLLACWILFLTHYFRIGPQQSSLSSTMCISLSTRWFFTAYKHIALVSISRDPCFRLHFPFYLFFFQHLCSLLQQNSFKKWCFSMFLPNSLLVFFLELIPNKIFSSRSQLNLSYLLPINSMSLNITINPFSLLDPGLISITVMSPVITVE